MKTNHNLQQQAMEAEGETLNLGQEKEWMFTRRMELLAWKISKSPEMVQGVA